MARPHDSERHDFSDAEKRDLIKLIEQGKPLPEKYHFLLFADKREVELVWNGRSREVCTAVLPFQTLEQIDEPRKEQRAQEELALDSGGRHTDLRVGERQDRGEEALTVSPFVDMTPCLRPPTPSLLRSSYAIGYTLLALPSRSAF